MEGKTRLYIVSATLWGIGFSLLYFSSNNYTLYNLPLYGLVAAPLLAVSYMSRKSSFGSKLAALSYMASFFASLPIFYVAGRVLYDELRSSGNVPPALVGIYEAFPGQFPYFLTLFLFTIFLASMAFYRAFEDFFERISLIEKFRITEVFLSKPSRLDLVGVAIGTATAFLSLKLGYTYVVLLPFLYFAKVQVLLAALLTSALIGFTGLKVDIIASLAAATAYYVLEAVVFSRYAGRVTLGVRKPMRIFLASISLLMVLLVFFTLFQVQAPLIAAIYILIAFPSLIAFSTLEAGALSLPLGVTMAVGAVLGKESGDLLAINGGALQVLAYMFMSTILAAQVSSYSTLITTGEETEECYIGLMEGGTALLAALVATWYYSVREPSFTKNWMLGAGYVSWAGLLLPLVALSVSFIHMVFATPFVSEGLWIAALNPVDPLGVLLGGLFPSPFFSAAAASALVLKFLNTRSGKLTPIMRGFIYGIGIAAVVFSVAAR